MAFANGLVCGRIKHEYSKTLKKVLIEVLNTSIKRQRLSEWIQKQNPAICCI